MIYRLTRSDRTLCYFKVHNWSFDFERDLTKVLEEHQYEDFWKEAAHILEEKGWQIGPAYLREVSLG